LRKKEPFLEKASGKNHEWLFFGELERIILHKITLVEYKSI